MPHRPDADYIQNERNTARFFVENRQISWILLIATVALGIYGYAKMPKRKDPNIPVRVASVQTQWPGADAGRDSRYYTRGRRYDLCSTIGRELLPDLRWQELADSDHPPGIVLVDDVTLTNLGIVAHDHGELAEARRCLERAMGIEPTRSTLGILL